MKIKVTCSECHADPELDPDQVTLYIKESFYRFTCPFCKAWIAKNTDERITALLVTAGVTIIREKPDYPEEIPDGLTPMSLDDVIDLYKDMNDWGQAD